MTQIDKTKPVLITGATGYVAGWLVKKLLEEGITVHAAVRDPNNEKKIAHLNEIAQNSPGKIVYFKADLLAPKSYTQAMQGCELVYHTASPFTSNFKDPQKELVDPAVKGTQNVLETANEIDTVKRVVVTSSCAAIYTDCQDVEDAPNGVLTEAVWNKTASLSYQPYSYSKTLAEKKAWEICAAQNKWELVVVNPSFVMGPALNPKVATSESISLLKQMGDGSFKSGAPDMGVGVVDVRDLGFAHYQAGFLPEAKGRNIISGHNTSFLEMAQILHSEYGEQYKLPTKAIPKWILWLVGPFVNKSLDRKYISRSVNKKWKADNSKSKKELNVTYRPLAETMVDGFKTLVDEKLI